MTHHYEITHLLTYLANYKGSCVFILATHSHSVWFSFTGMCLLKPMWLFLMPWRKPLQRIPLLMLPDGMLISLVLRLLTGSNSPRVKKTLHHMSLEVRKSRSEIGLYGPCWLDSWYSCRSSETDIFIFSELRPII